MTPIDRRALVSRHSIDWPSLSGQIPLGNGNFAFNADGTGLETFGGNTMSHWCWHSFPLPTGTTEKDIHPWAALESGRLKGPTTPPPLLKDWLFQNPHPLTSGRLGFIDAQGNRIAETDCVSTSRHLDLWTGLLTSRFTYQGEAVTVQTCVSPTRDLVAATISSPLLRSGHLRVRLDFPSPSAPGSTDPRTGHAPWAGDFSNPANHRTELVSRVQDGLSLKRTVNATTYWVALAGEGVGLSSQLSGQSSAIPSNRVDFGATESDTLALGCCFSAEEFSPAALPHLRRNKGGLCRARWPRFWRSGGATTFPKARNRAGRSWSGGSCSPNTNWQSNGGR